MNTNLSCRTVRRWLTPFHDGELQIADRSAVREHLETCPDCTVEARQLQEIRELLQEQMSESPVPPLDGFRATVLSRWKAENQASWLKVLRTTFADAHLVCSGAAAVMATLVVVALMSGIFKRVHTSAPDSLASVLRAPVLTFNAIAKEPLLDASVALPQISPPPIFQTLDSQDDRVITLAASVTKHGRVEYVEVLRAVDLNRHQIGGLMHAASAARFLPARRGGAPVAVNMVWLLAHTTVRGKVAG